LGFGWFRQENGEFGLATCNKCYHFDDLNANPILSGEGGIFPYDIRKFAMRIFA
jgi:hypothetical protein